MLPTDVRKEDTGARTTTATASIQTDVNKTASSFSLWLIDFQSDGGLPAETQRRRRGEEQQCVWEGGVRLYGSSALKRAKCPHVSTYVQFVL